MGTVSTASNKYERLWYHRHLDDRDWRSGMAGGTRQKGGADQDEILWSHQAQTTRLVRRDMDAATAAITAARSLLKRCSPR